MCRHAYRKDEEKQLANADFPKQNIFSHIRPPYIIFIFSKSQLLLISHLTLGASNPTASANRKTSSWLYK